MKSIVAEEIDATFGSAGTLEAHVRMTLRGDHELRARTIFRSIPAARWKSVLEGIVEGQGTTGDVSSTQQYPPTRSVCFPIPYFAGARWYGAVMSSRSLEPRQEAFCRHYASSQNASEAARKAGYRGKPKQIATTAARLLANAGSTLELPT